MKKFHFKLDPLLKLRTNQRDQCRQLLADVLRRDDELVHRRSETEKDRRIQIDELRDLGSAGAGVNVDASVSRRSYAGHLSGHIGSIEAERAALSRQIDLCRQALIRADQAVKSLEKLAERQRSDFVFTQQSVEARELEQTWQAVRAQAAGPHGERGQGESTRERWYS
jgi:flagellar export protein FliJ